MVSGILWVGDEGRAAKRKKRRAEVEEGASSLQQETDKVKSVLFWLRCRFSRPGISFRVLISPGLWNVETSLKRVNFLVLHILLVEPVPFYIYMAISNTFPCSSMLPCSLILMFGQLEACFVTLCYNHVVLFHIYILNTFPFNLSYKCKLNMIILVVSMFKFKIDNLVYFILCVFMSFVDSIKYQVEIRLANWYFKLNFCTVNLL